MREEISWLENDETYEESVYLFDRLEEYREHLEHGRYREAEKSARCILDYVRMD